MNKIYRKPIIIIGAGGHAKVVADTLQKSGNVILGFVTPDLEADSDYCGYKVLGDDGVLASYPARDILLANGIGALPKKKLRWTLAKQMRIRGYSFASVVHPSAIIADDVILAEGVQIMAGVVIQAGVKIGRDSIINTRASVDHDCTIDINCHLAPGVVCSGGVCVGDNTHLATSVSVIQNISIGSHCTIAAGCVVYHDVDDATTMIQVRQENKV